MPLSTLQRRWQKIEIQWCHKARSSPTSPKPSPPWPGSSSKQLQDTTGVSGCRWIGGAKRIPSGWTGNTSETWGGYCWTYGYCEDIGHDGKTCQSKIEGHKENATISGNMGGNPYGKPRAWGQERVGEIISNTKMNISHDLRVINLDPIADSGATLKCSCMTSPSEYDKQIEPIRALLPDGNKISAHIQCKIKMDGIPEQSKIAYKFNGIQEPLVSIPVLCENGCTFTFTKQTVQVNKEGKTVLTGYM